MDKTTHQEDTISHSSIIESIHRIDSLREFETKRLDEKIRDGDVKYQIQFSAAKEALGIALIAQEKAVAAALEGTKEAINKADVATDKRFELLSEKITGVTETLNKNAGAQGIYVTHGDLSNEMEKLRTSFEAMLRPVITFMNNSQGGKAQVNSVWGYVIGGSGFLFALVALILRLYGK
jgi:hypothetical protein